MHNVEKESDTTHNCGYGRFPGNCGSLIRTIVQGRTKRKVTLTVSAATSAQDALEEIQTNYEKSHSNVTIQDNFGSSGTLQKQISQGAGADLFFSATEDKFEKLVHDGDIDKKDSTDLLKNDLVMIVPEKNSAHLTHLNDLKKTARKKSRSARLNPFRPDNTPNSH